MRFTPASLAGAFSIEPEPAVDVRGAFMRTFCVDEMEAHGLETRFLQHSTSLSVAAGTLRGMHFQIAPHEEVKVVTCLKGALYDVIIDLRPSSPSYRKWQGFELSAENRRQLYIPKGLAHGFVTREDNTEAGYLISERHAPTSARGVRWNDPSFGIEWPVEIRVMNDKDRAWPDYVSS